MYEESRFCLQTYVGFFRPRHRQLQGLYLPGLTASPGKLPSLYQSGVQPLHCNLWRELQWGFRAPCLAGTSHVHPSPSTLGLYLRQRSLSGASAETLLWGAGDCGETLRALLPRLTQYFPTPHPPLALVLTPRSITCHCPLFRAPSTVSPNSHVCVNLPAQNWSTVLVRKMEWECQCFLQFQDSCFNQ